MLSYKVMYTTKMYGPFGSQVSKHYRVSIIRIPQKSAHRDNGIMNV